MRRAGVCALLLILMASIASASWEEHTRAGEWAFSRGDYDRAETELQAALDEAQRFPAGDRRLETSLSNLGRLYEHQMRYAEAQPLFQLMLAARELRLGETHSSLLEPLAAVARTSLRIGDPPSAEAALKRYVEVADVTGEAPADELWQVLSLLSRVMVLQERHEEALQAQRRTVEVLLEDDWSEPSARAAELETLAQLELLHGDASRSEDLIERAIALRGESEDAAEAMVAAAETAFAAGQTQPAERWAERALAVAADESLQGRALIVLCDVSMLTVGRSSGSLGDVVGVSADDPASHETLERHRRLMVLLDATGADPARLRTTAERLATLSAMTGDIDDAIRWQREVVANPGESGLEARWQLVQLLVAADRPDQAVIENELVISGSERTFGESGPQLVEPLRTQQALLEDLGRKKEARAVKKRLRKLERTLR